MGWTEPFCVRYPTDTLFEDLPECAMEGNGSAQIICADKIGDGLLIYFNDGKIGFYSSSLLRATLREAVEVKSNDVDEEQPT